MSHKYFYIERDDLSNRGYNKGVEVYKLVPGGYPKFIGGNYSLSSAAWAGYLVSARKLVKALCGHKLPDPYRDFPAKNVSLVELGTNGE